MRKRILYVSLFAALTMFCLKGHHLSLTTLPKRGLLTEGKHTMNSTSLNLAIPKRTNIYFMKVHKTGSTTMYNIFSRFAYHHNLTVASYNYDQRPFFSSYDREAIVKCIKPEFRIGINNRFNMLIDHSNFDLPSIEQAIESPIFYITLLRRPLDMLRSWHFFLGYGTRQLENGSKVYFDPLLSYLQYPKKDLINPVTKQFRLGEGENMTRFVEQLQLIDQMFIVGINEYFNHSMVYFKRHLGWDIKDLVFLPLRKQLYHNHLTFNKNSDKRIGKQVCLLNKFDCYIYTYFNTTLWQYIDNAGSEFHEEVKFFEIILENVSSFCNSLIKTRREMYSSVLHIDKYVYIEQSRWNNNFNVTQWDCAIMSLNEKALLHYFFYVQNPKECINILRSNKRKKNKGRFIMTLMNMCQYAPDKLVMLQVLLKDIKSYIRP